MTTLGRLAAVAIPILLLGCTSTSESARRANELVRACVDHNSPCRAIPLFCSDTARPTSTTTTTRASTGPATTQSTTKPSFNWQFEWQGWDGLYIEAVQTTSLKNPSPLFGQGESQFIQLEEVKFTSRIGARFDFDAAAFDTGGDLTGFDDGAQLRRALITAVGGFELILPIQYDIQIGYIPHQFYTNQAIFSLPHIDYIGSPQFGVFGPPMGLDLITSSRDITFMEPASVLQALAPGNEYGIQIGQPILNQRATWALGIFGAGPDNNEYGNASENYGNLIGRMSGLAIDHIDQLHPAQNEYLHLALSANAQYSTTATVRYKSKPESYIAPVVIDTNNIDASGAFTFGTECAYVKGPLCIQNEFLYSFVNQNSGEGLNFWGFYVDAGWYLTGESRPYDRAEGDFTRLIPRRNFKWGGHGEWGALQVAARYSYTNLGDGDIEGGRLSLLMAALNWYPQPHIRWLFNAGVGNIDGTAQDGALLIFQTRIGVDF